MAGGSTFNKLDIIVISCFVFFIWAIVMVLVYYSYQVFYLDERTNVSGIDDSTSSTSIFLGASGGSDEENMSNKSMIEKGIANIREQFRDFFFNTTYNFNILVDHENKVLIETVVMNGDLGIGLDIKKGKNNSTVVSGFKEFPSYTANPAKLCKPAIEVGDCIVGIDGEAVDTFAKTLVTMKESQKGELTLHLRRLKPPVKEKKYKKSSGRRQL